MENKKLKETFDTLKNINLDELESFVFVGLTKNAENVLYRAHNNLVQLAIISSFINSEATMKYALNKHERQTKG